MQGISQKLLALGEGEESRTLLLRKERFISRQIGRASCRERVS